MKHHLTKAEQEIVLRKIQKATGRKQPRRYLNQMFDLCCLYFLIYEDRPRQYLVDQIDDFIHMER